MSRIWKILQQSGTGAIGYATEPETRLKPDGDGTPFGAHQVFPPFIWVDKDEESHLSLKVRRAVDFPDFNSGLMVCKTSMWQLLEPHVQSEVQAVEISVEGEPYFLLNVVNVVDCLDREKSELLILSNGNVGGARKLSFKEGAGNGHYLFKIPELPFTRIFATAKFKGLIEELGATGLDFVAPNFRY